MKLRTKSSACRLCGSPVKVIDPAHLRQLREDAGLSLEGLAAAGERAGCERFTRSYLSDVERGRRGVSHRVLEVYEKVLLKGAKP